MKLSTPPNATTPCSWPFTSAHWEPTNEVSRRSAFVNQLKERNAKVSRSSAALFRGFGRSCGRYPNPRCRQPNGSLDRGRPDVPFHRLRHIAWHIGSEQRLTI